MEHEREIKQEFGDCDVENRGQLAAQRTVIFTLAGSVRQTQDRVDLQSELPSPYKDLHEIWGETNQCGGYISLRVILFHYTGEFSAEMAKPVLLYIKINCF